jgi:hypothetical protein
MTARSGGERKFETLAKREGATAAERRALLQAFDRRAAEAERTVRVVWDRCD